PLNTPAPVTGCLSAAAMALGSLLVFADEDLVVREEDVRRYPQVIGRGLVLEDAPREVEERPVAGTIEAALPGRVERLRARLEAILRRATEVRADADHHEELRLPRPEFVARVGGRELVLLALALGVGDPVVVPPDRLEHLRRAMQDP